MLLVSAIVSIHHLFASKRYKNNKRKTCGRHSSFGVVSHSVVLLHVPSTHSSIGTVSDFICYFSLRCTLDDSSASRIFVLFFFHSRQRLTHTYTYTDTLSHTATQTHRHAQPYRVCLLSIYILIWQLSSAPHQNDFHAFCSSYIQTAHTRICALRSFV